MYLCIKREEQIRIVEDLKNLLVNQNKVCMGNILIYKKRKMRLNTEFYEPPVLSLNENLYIYSAFTEE